jgi:hypothetical protein
MGFVFFTYFNANSLRNTILIPKNGIAKTLAFSIRELSSAIPYTATLYINGIDSGFSATILDGSVNYGVITIGTVILNNLDLISIYLSYPSSGGALNNGICATLTVA